MRYQRIFSVSCALLHMGYAMLSLSKFITF
jgi:hypothetical protein